MLIERNGKVKRRIKVGRDLPSMALGRSTIIDAENENNSRCFPNSLPLKMLVFDE